MREDFNHKKTKTQLRYIIIGFLISSSMIIATTPVHEAAHWIMSDLDPYVEPVEFHVFDTISFQNKENILPSALGFVKIKEKYPGAFDDRPPWADILQEVICVSIQVLLSVAITLVILTHIMKRKQPTIIPSF
jgi:hypothetical protein